MRFQIQGYRIKFGVPLFITISPDESHNLLMVRLSLTRRNDPVVKYGREDVNRDIHDRGFPPMDVDRTDDAYSVESLCPRQLQDLAYGICENVRSKNK